MIQHVKSMTKAMIARSWSPRVWIVGSGQVTEQAVTFRDCKFSIWSQVFGHSRVDSTGKPEKTCSGGGEVVLLGLSLPMECSTLFKDKSASYGLAPFRGGFMETGEQIKTRSSMRKVILYGTIIAGVIAAYLMYRRGESLTSIAKQAVTNPVGSMVSEVKNAV